MENNALLNNSCVKQETKTKLENILSWMLMKIGHIKISAMKV